jgi:hypothetical protein
MAPYGTLRVVFGGLISKIDSPVEIKLILSGFPKVGRRGGRFWIWDGVSLLILNPRSGSLSRMFLTSTIAATDRVSTSQVEIWWFALSSLSEQIFLVRKRVPIPLLFSREFELV